MAILFSVNWAILSAQYGPINDWPTERIHKSRALPDSFHSFASVRSGQPPSRRSPPAPPPAIASLPSAARYASGSSLLPFAINLALRRADSSPNPERAKGG